MGLDWVEPWKWPNHTREVWLQIEENLCRKVWISESVVQFKFWNSIKFLISIGWNAMWVVHLQGRLRGASGPDFWRGWTDTTHEHAGSHHSIWWVKFFCTTSLRDHTWRVFLVIISFINWLSLANRPNSVSPWLLGLLVRSLNLSNTWAKYF